MFSYFPVLSSYFPLLPHITLLSRYTGYTGSVMATLTSCANKSTIFPVSHFAPSDTNTSSGSICKFAYSFSTILFLRNSYPCSGPYPLKVEELPISSTPFFIASITTLGIGLVTSPIPSRIISAFEFSLRYSSIFLLMVENK